MKSLVTILCTVCLATSLVALIGCNKSEEPKPDEAVAAAPEPAGEVDARRPAQPPAGLPPFPTPGQGGEPPADLMKALAEAQAQMASGKNADGTAIEQIAWKDLSSGLPIAVDGWKMDGEIKGSSSKMMGMSVSQAECKMTKGDAKAHVTIVDTSMNPMLAMPFSMARSLQVDSDKETRGPVSFGEYPGTKAFMKKRNKAEVLVMVKNRLLITVRVEQAKGVESAEELAKNVKFDQLAALIK